MHCTFGEFIRISRIYYSISLHMSYDLYVSNYNYNSHGMCIASSEARALTRKLSNITHVSRYQNLLNWIEATARLAVLFFFFLKLIASTDANMNEPDHNVSLRFKLRTHARSTVHGTFIPSTRPFERAEGWIEIVMNFDFGWSVYCERSSPSARPTSIFYDMG